MPSSIKKEFDYNITNLDWGDGSDLEFVENPKLFDRLDSLEHTYEMPGFYTIKGLVYKKALQLVNIYPPVEEDSSIHYESIEIENTDNDHDYFPISTQALLSSTDEETYLGLSNLNFNRSGSEVTLNPSARGGYLINETFRSGTQIEIVESETDDEFDKSISVTIPSNAGGITNTFDSAILINNFYGDGQDPPEIGDVNLDIGTTRGYDDVFILTNSVVDQTDSQQYLYTWEANILDINAYPDLEGRTRTKNAGIRFNLGLELDMDKNNFFEAEFDAWLPNFGRLDDSDDLTQYVLEIRLTPENEESEDRREFFYFSGTNGWQTIKGNFFNSVEYYKSMYVEFRQLDRNLDAPDQNNTWQFYIKNIQMKIQNTNNIKFPLQWERFRSNIVVNPASDYDSPFFEKNDFIMVGGMSKQSYYYKSLSSLIGYDFNTDEKKENFSYDKYNPYDIILGLDTLAKFDVDLYDSYLNPYSFARYDNNGNKINNGMISRKWHSTFKDTALTETDIASVRITSGVRPMWRQLGFSSNEFDNPSKNFYWKNIIPKDFDLSNRDGITQRDLPDPMKGSLTPRISRKEYIVDEEATQNWNDGYYWPALPKYDRYGGFSDEFPIGYENQTYGSDDSTITSLNINNPNISFDLSFDNNEILDKTDNNDVKLNVDFTLILNSNNRIVKSSEDFSDTIETDNLRQAF